MSGKGYKVLSEEPADDDQGGGYVRGPDVPEVTGPSGTQALSAPKYKVISEEPENSPAGPPTQERPLWARALTTLGLVREPENADEARGLPSLASSKNFTDKMDLMANHPWQAAGREVADLAAPMFAGPSGSLGGAVAQAAAHDYLRGYSDTGSASEGANQALEGAGATAALGGVGKAVGGVVSAAGDALRESGLANRVAATGLYGAQYRNMVANHGPDYVQNLGRQIEDAGLHEGNAMGGKWNPMNWLPQPVSTYADNAKDLERTSLSQMKNAEGGLAALENKPQINMGGVAQTLRDRAGRVADMADPAGAQEAQFSTQMADNLEKGGNDWQKALANRRYLDENVNWSKRGGYEGAAMQEQVRRDAANGLRGELSSALDRGVASGDVPAELAQGWQQGRNGFSLAKQVGDVAEARVAQEQGNQLLSLPSWAAAAGGLATGSPINGLAAGVGAQLMKTRGRSAAAGLLGGAGELAQGFGGAASNFATSGMANATNELFSPAAGRGEQNSLTGAPPEDPDAAAKEAWANMPPEERMSRASDQGRGNLLPQAALDLLHTNPGALGEYQSQFAQAAASPETGAVSALVQRLYNRDPTFRATALVEMQRITAQK